MKLMRYIVLLPFLIFASNANSNGLDTEQFVSDGAFILFNSACLHLYPRGEEFDLWVKDNNFIEVPSNQLQGLIGVSGGKGYSVNIMGVKYLLIAQNDNLCSVFVKNVSLEKVEITLNKFLSGLENPEININLTTSEKMLSKGRLTTRTYDISHKDINVLTIVVSTSNSSNAFFQLALSSKICKKCKEEATK